MSYKHTKLLVILLLITLGSCTNDAPVSKSKLSAYGPVFEKVMVTENGAFRGFSLGDPLDSIQAKETAKLTEADDGYLYYESKLDDTTGSFNISYSFDETGLSEIQSDIYVNDINDADVIFDQFKNYFDKHYGSSESHMGFTVWTVKSEKYGEIRVNLSNESADFTTAKPPGKVSLWIYPDKD